TSSRRWLLRVVEAKCYQNHTISTSAMSMNFCYTESMTTPGTIKTVILDFDDTMYLSEEACFFLENEVLRRMGREPQTRDVHLATWGMQVEAAMHQRSPGIDIADFWKTMNMTHAEFVKD